MNTRRTVSPALFAALASSIGLASLVPKLRDNGGPVMPRGRIRVGRTAEDTPRHIIIARRQRDRRNRKQAQYRQRMARHGASWLQKT